MRRSDPDEIGFEPLWFVYGTVRRVLRPYAEARQMRAERDNWKRWALTAEAELETERLMHRQAADAACEYSDQVDRLCDLCVCGYAASEHALRNGRCPIRLGEWEPRYDREDGSSAVTAEEAARIARRESNASDSHAFRENHSQMEDS